jgi:predicted O-methyltransferase YrrM
MGTDLRELLASVDGWLTEAEGELLFRLASRCSGRGVIVEVGSWKGKSTIALSHGSRAGASAAVHAVDPHVGSPEHKEMFGEVSTFDQFSANVARAGVGDLVRPIVRRSEDAARDFPHPVELAFIDGDHDYEAVKRDFEVWFPKVVDGGLMAFHDSSYQDGRWPGPTRLVEEALFKSRRFRNVRRVDSITYGEKVANASLAERLGNYRRLWSKRAYEWNVKGRLQRASRAVPLPSAIRSGARRALRRLIAG